MNGTEHQERVEQLMYQAGQAVPQKPEIPVLDVRKLRAKLILEESLETIRGLGFDVKPGQDGLECVAGPEPDIIEIVDGCADVSVVTIGTLSAFGVKDDPILAAVDANNLGTFGPGSFRREDGKWMKPPGYKPADIMGLLKAQGYAG